MATLREPRERACAVATLLIATLMASSVAFYNGYPTVYPDTGAYLGLHNHGDRSIFYSLFLAPLRLTHTLWSAVLLQSLLVVYLLRIVLREVFSIRSRLEFLAIIGLLCMLTSLPWGTAYLMADIFTPMLVLGLFMLAFGFAGLTGWERCFVVALTFVALVVHYSHLPLALGLVTAGGIARWMRKRYSGGAKPHLALPTIVVTVGLVAVVISNYLMFGLATLSPGGSVFVLARLIENGPAVAYLRANCPRRQYAVCADLARMPMSESGFLWSQDGPISKLHFIGERTEATEIVTGTIKSYPMWVLRDAIADTLRQLVRNRTGDGLQSRAEKQNPTVLLQKLYPGDFEAYLNSRQNRGELVRMRAIPDLDSIFLLISLGGCCLLAKLFAASRRWLPVELMGTVGFAILLNAFVTGALAEPLDRYGSRVIWLVPLIAIASWRTANPRLTSS
jgi:hypothetical protein